MQESTEPSFFFEKFTLDPRRGCLRAGDRELALRPKNFAMLLHLVENSGRLVSKDELIKTVWRDVVVTETSLARCISDIRLALEDNEQRIIKTVFRRGYLFAAEVHRDSSAYDRILPETGAVRPQLSLVVLPFVNLGSEDQSGLVEGVTENLTTDLSRVRDAFVIASKTAASYRSKALDARQIGHELGVRYVLEGSIQPGTERVRVNAQLIDAETGAHLWADRFDTPCADVFDVQDRITARLVRTVGIELLEAAGRRVEIERPKSMNSLDLALRGRAMLSRPLSLARVREARGLLEEAVRLDHRNVTALNCLAAAYTYEVNNLLSDDPEPQIYAAEAAILKSLAMAPDSAYGHFVYSSVLYAQCKPKRALDECAIAIDLDGNLAIAHAQSGLVKTCLGRPEETESAVVEAMRRSPRDPMMGSWHMWIGMADLYLDRIDRAIERLRQATGSNPNLGLAWYFLAAALALANSDAEAKEACAIAWDVMPGLTLSRLRSHRRSDNPRILGQGAQILEGMRKAGIPD